MAERHPCDVILLDLRMPDGSGYEVIRGLKLGPAPSSVPIIVLTNFPEATNAEERRLLHSQLVLEVFAKTRVARDPGTLIERLEAVRSRTWDA
jgi:CheY-like chemotaxis protein